MRKYLLLILLLSATLRCPGLSHDGPGYHLRQYTDENGLPQNSVQDLAFGNYGFVWIATQGGLARFDGQNMRVFTRKELLVNSDRYVAVGFDVQVGTDILAAITEHRQLVMIDGGTAFRDNRPKAQQMAGFCRLKSQLAGTDIKIDTARGADNYLQYKLVVADREHYYLYTDHKVAFFERGKLVGAFPFKGIPYFKPLPSVPSVRREVVAHTKGMVCVDNFMSISGKLFYHTGSEGAKLLKISVNESIPLTLTGDIERNPAFAAKKNRIRIVTNRFKGQAFAYLDRNIYQIVYNTGSGQLETKLLIQNLDIEEKLIHRMLYDEGNGTLFLGSLSQGLFVARSNLFQVVGTGPGNPHNSFFYAQVPFSDSSVLTPEGLVISRANSKPVKGDFFRTQEDVYHYAMMRDSDGYVWGTEPHGFFRSNGRQRDIIHTGKLQPERLCQGMGRGLWIGFMTGELAYLPPRADMSRQPKILTKVNAKCTFLHQDRPGRVWMGATSGLFMYDSLRNSVYPVPGLRGKNIRSIFHSRPDELWITTYGDGIFLLKANRLYKMPPDDKHYLAYAHCILKDNKGYFWISANKGLFRTKEQDLLDYAAGKSNNVLYLYHDKNDGFLTNEFNGGCQPCGVKLNNGYFSFPSMNGLVWFRPEAIPLPDLSAPIRFEAFEVDEKAINTRDTIQLPYNYNHFSFTAVAAFMGHADDVEFFYSIQKAASTKPKWHRVSNGQRVDIYRMSAGCYTVVVRETIGFGGKFRERRLVLEVKTPWFVSWWFIALVVLAVCEGVRQITRWRVRNLTRQNELLVEKVNERTIDLSRALEGLKASDEALQTQLQIQMRIIGAINHDLHAPLRSLSQHIPRYLEQVAAQPNDPLTIRLGESIGKSTAKVFRLADELLLFIKTTYKKKGRIAYEPLQLGDILRQKVQFFGEMAHDSQVTFAVDCAPELVVTSNRVMTEILFHNLIDNALKHTYAQTVRIAASAEASGVKVTISDAGFGMDREIVEWLNHHAGEVRPDAAAAPPTPPNLGLGLIMVMEIAILLGIRIRVVSGSDGTTFACVFGE
jgi:signal transduction histidine kinase